MHEEQDLISFDFEGGDSGVYADDSYCTWQIQCPQSQVAVLAFSKLEVEDDFDFVRLYNGDDESQPPMAELTGTLGNMDETQYVSSGSSLLIAFESDESEGGQGFQLQYHCEAAQPPPPPTTPCDADPCTHGSCEARGQDFECRCYTGWTGTLCDTNSNPCADPATNQCQNGAICVPWAGEYLCTCLGDFEGEFCDQQMAPPPPSIFL